MIEMSFLKLLVTKNISVYTSNRLDVTGQKKKSVTLKIAIKIFQNETKGKMGKITTQVIFEKIWEGFNIIDISE